MGSQDKYIVIGIWDPPYFSIRFRMNSDTRYTIQKAWFADSIKS
jgi:hypothetical protein